MRGTASVQVAALLGNSATAEELGYLVDRPAALRRANILSTNTRRMFANARSVESHS